MDCPLMSVSGDGAMLVIICCQKTHKVELCKDCPDYPLKEK
jgi:hypothetical protein